MPTHLSWSFLEQCIDQQWIDHIMTGPWRTWKWDGASRDNEKTFKIFWFVWRIILKHFYLQFIKTVFPLPRIWQTPSSSSVSRENHGNSLPGPQPEPCPPGRRQVTAGCRGLGPNHGWLHGQSSESQPLLWKQHWTQLLVVQYQIWRCNWCQGKVTSDTEYVFNDAVLCYIFITLNECHEIIGIKRVQDLMICLYIISHWT